MEKIFNWGTTVSKEELIEKIKELSTIVLDNTTKNNKLFTEIDKSSFYTKIVTIRLKLSEVREVLDRKRNHQSILRRI